MPGTDTPRAAQLQTGAVGVDRIVEREHRGFVKASEPAPPTGEPGPTVIA